MPETVHSAAGVVSDTQADVLLQASAGTGKTYNLTQRILRILRHDRVPIDQVLVLTFTDLAAAEMRDKIYHSLLQAADAAETQEERDFLRVQKALFGRNSIGTIHSFAAKVLRRSGDLLTAYIETAVPAGFGIPDLLRNAMPNRWSEQPVQIDAYEKSRLEMEWQKEFVRLHRSHAPTVKLLERCGRTAAFFRHLNDLAKLADSHLAEMARLEDGTYMAQLEAAYAGLQGQLLAPWERVRHALADYEEYLTGPLPHHAYEFMYGGWLTDTGFSKRKVAKMEDAEAREEICKRLTNVVKPLIPYRKLEPLYHRAVEALRAGEAAEDNPSGRADLQMLENLRLLAETALRWKQFTRWKRAGAGFVDFDDLILLAHRLVTTEPEVAERLRQRYRHILVDEFQDTDPLQWDIIRTIRGDGPGRRLFMVGDMKQAIYGFRGGNVSLIRAVADAGEVATGTPLRTASLPVSFRSRHGVLEYVNRQFVAVMAPLHTERQYQSDYAALQPRPDALGGTVSVHRFRKAAGPGREDVLRFAEQGAKMLDAYHTAAFLADLKEGADRYPEYREIGEKLRNNEKAVGILVRTKANIEHLTTALRLFGLPASVKGGGGFFDRQEVSDLYYLLRFLNDAWDDMALAAVLRSPLFCLSDLGLLAIVTFVRRQGERMPWWHAISEHLDSIRAQMLPPDAASLAEARRLLREWRNTVRSQRIAAILELAVVNTPFLAGQDDPAAVAENVYKLADLIRGMEDDGRGGLQAVIAWLNFQRNDTRDADAEVPDAGSIQIMTMHASKGLQFPMVILSNLSQGGQSRSGLQISPLDLHASQLPLAALAGGDDEDASFEKTAPAFLKEYLKLQLKEREKAETLRLFYVAATRAEDHLILNDTTDLSGSTQHNAITEALGQFLEAGDAAGLRTAEVGYAEYASLLDRILSGGAARQTAAGEYPQRLVTPRLTEALQTAYAPVVTPSTRQPGPTVGGVAQWEALTPEDAGTLIHIMLQRPGLSDAVAMRSLQFEAEGLDYSMVQPGVQTDMVRIRRHAQAARQALDQKFPLVRRTFREHPVEAFLPHGRDGDLRWVRGAIDLLLEDRDGVWHIVDFKTATPELPQLASHAAMYARQLHAYADALREVSGGEIAVPPEHSWLLFTGYDEPVWISLAEMR